MTGHVLADMNEIVSNDFSSSHQAIDIVGTGGSDDVISFDGGIVEVVVKNFKYTNHNSRGNATYGNYVKIRHDDGTKTLYAHLKYGTVVVDVGQHIDKGQVIGKMGNTGNAYGVHLHFEVRNGNEVRMDPKDFLYQKNVVSNEEVQKNSDNEVENGIVEEQNKNEIISEDEKKEPNISENDDADLEDNIIEEVNDLIMGDSEENDIIAIKNDILKTFYHKSNDNYVDNHDYQGGSIVDCLKEIGIDSSFENRSVIALKNSISDYNGTYNQNVYLLNLLKQGKLKA